MSPPDLPLVLTADEAADALRISRWAVYEAVKRGELRAVRLGRTLRIPRAAITELLGGAPEREEAPGPAGASIVPLDPAKAGGHRPR